MKKTFLLLLFTMIYALGWSQIMGNYDFASNTVTVQYTGCSLCEYNTIDNINKCQCYYDCMNSDEDCIDECAHLGVGTSYYNWCRHSCCSDYCGGAPPEKVRTPVSFTFRLMADWADIPFDPTANPNNRVFSGTFNISAPTFTTTWVVPAPWPGIYLGHNTCYGIMITITYDDDATCTGTLWFECNIIG